MGLKTLIKHGTSIVYKPPFSSVWSMLTHHAHQNPIHQAIVSIDVDTAEYSQITYQELLDLVGKTAHFLLSLGIKKGDRFAILMPNTVEILIFELAGGVIGATTVPLDSKRDTLDRKLYKISDTGAKVLFVKTQEQTAELKTLSKRIKTVKFGSVKDFLELTNKQSPSIHPSLIADLKSLYLILYTSGTTALPKGVPITTQALLANAESIAKWQHLSSKDRFNITLPLHHINSTTMSFATILQGGTVILNSRYSASKFWQIVSKEKCTITSVVPTVLHDLLVRSQEFQEQKLDVTSLKRILIGSAPVLPEETLKFYKTFHIRVIQGYGQTETALRVTGTPVTTSEKEYVNAVKTNTIGIELTNCNVTILTKNGKEAKEKAAGEICIRGPILGEGYLNNPGETKKSFYDGWFHSGDLGYWKYQSSVIPNSFRDPKQKNDKMVKYFYIIGRLKEIIIKGGINLSPAMIEDALLKNFPEIDEVSVVGYDDIRMGEEVAAVIVLKRHSGKSEGRIQNPHQDDVITKILNAARNNKISGLSAYEVPQKVFIIDSLPKTSTGKIQRVEVKKWVTEKIDQEKPLHYYIRQIKPDEKEIINEVVKINNDRWTGLPATVKEFTVRAKNGLLFGVFEETAGLVGSLSCVQLKSAVVNKLKTWNETSGYGTLSNHDPKGDALVCVAISVKSPHPVIPSEVEGSPSPVISNAVRNPQHDSNAEGDLSASLRDDKLNELAKQKIHDYVNAYTDHVLNFHEKPKGGLNGAKVWKILENGRPDDTEALGYNVIMKYPEIPKTKKIIHTNSSSPSILLIEHALAYSQKHGIKNVYAFSRPSGFKKYLLSKLS